MAEAVAAGLQLVIDAHPLIEDVALPLPTAALLGDLLEVLQDSALQVVDVLKALMEQIGRALLAADATGAEHRNRLGLCLLHQRPQRLLDPGGEFTKAFRPRINRPREAAHFDFVAVARVHHQGLRIGDQGVPLLGGDIGAHLLGRLHRGAAHGDDLPLQPHLEPVEGLLLRAAELGLQPPRPGQLPQPIQDRRHTGIGATDGPVHSLVSQQDRAPHAPLLRQGFEFLLQRRKSLHGGEAIEGHHQAAHAGTCSCQGVTPARAISC